jgi:hypothetical protein
MAPVRGSTAHVQTGREEGLQKLGYLGRIVIHEVVYDFPRSTRRHDVLLKYSCHGNMNQARNMSVLWICFKTNFVFLVCITFLSHVQFRIVAALGGST